MRPVAQARTRSGATPSSAAATAVDSSTVRRPSAPVQALALPAWTSTAAAVPARRRARVTITGAAGARCVVPARARIVASDLPGVAADGLDLLQSRGRRPTVREADALPRRLLLAALHVDHRRGQLGLEVDRLAAVAALCLHRHRLRLQLDAHQLLDDVHLHAADQLLEQVVPFLLVLLQRVLLTVAA